MNQLPIIFFWKFVFWQQKLPNLEFVMEFKIKYQEIFKLLLADSESERERERESPFREAKRWSSFAKRIHGATTHLLLELRLIGPGQRLALPAWGQRWSSSKSKKSFSCSCSYSYTPWGKHHCYWWWWMVTFNSFLVLILVSSIWHVASEPTDDAASSS